MVIDPNIKNSKGSNALHTACIASHDVNITEMMELLIERYYHYHHHHHHTNLTVGGLGTRLILQLSVCE